MQLLECVFSILLLLTSQSLSDAEAEEAKEGGESLLPGHMQPLGSHMSPEFVKRVSDVLRASEFVEQYVQPKQPVIFEGLIRDLRVRKNWADDDFLRSVCMGQSRVHTVLTLNVRVVYISWV